MSNNNSTSGHPHFSGKDIYRKTEQRLKGREVGDSLKGVARIRAEVLDDPETQRIIGDGLQVVNDIDVLRTGAGNHKYLCVDSKDFGPWDVEPGKEATERAGAIKTGFTKIGQSQLASVTQKPYGESFRIPGRMHPKRHEEYIIGLTDFASLCQRCENIVIRDNLREAIAALPAPTTVPGRV